jgi:hypothetical protein
LRRLPGYTISLPRVGYRVEQAHTQFSHLSQWQLSTAPLNTPRSPQYSTTHQSSTSAFTSVNSRLKLHRPIPSALDLPCTAGRIRYRKNALANLHAWCVKLSGSEYAPTGTPYSSYVVIVCWKGEESAGAACFRGAYVEEACAAWLLVRNVRRGASGEIVSVRGLICGYEAGGARRGHPQELVIMSHTVLQPPGTCEGKHQSFFLLRADR